jgi:hypothetical protein
MQYLPSRRRWPVARRGAIPLGRIGLLVLIGIEIGTPARSAEEPTWPLGSWRVLEHGLGWGSELQRLEIRPAATRARRSSRR